MCSSADAGTSVGAGQKIVGKVEASGWPCASNGISS